MSLVSRDRLAAACQDVDSETLTAFVADLFEAQGFETERVGEGRFRVQPGDRLVAIEQREGATPEADVVVAVDSPVTAEGGRVLDAEDIHRQVCYGVDRDVARTLLSTHFGLDPSATTDTEGDPAAGGTAGRVDGSGAETPPGIPSVRRSSPAWTRMAVAVCVVSVLLVVGSLAVPMGPLAQGISFAGPGGATPTPVESVTLTPERVEESRGGGGSSDIDGSEINVDRPPGDGLRPDSYPPGVTARGIVDHERFVDAHASLLSNTSYTVRLSYREFVDGRLAGVHTETVRVGNGSRFRVSVSHMGEFRTPPREILGSDVFANGSDAFVRQPDARGISRPVTDADRYLSDLSRYLRWSLSVRESGVRQRETDDGDGSLVVVTGEEDYPGIENASGTVYATSDGLVEYGRWTYRRASQPNVRVEFAVRTTGVGETTVTRPEWVDE
jgi:hypothetical protein